MAFGPSSEVVEKDDNKYKLDVLLNFQRLWDDGDRAFFAPDHPGPDYGWMKEVQMGDCGQETLHDHFLRLWGRIITSYVSGGPEEQAHRHLQRTCSLSGGR